jgi:hypothetical protein
LELAVAVEKVDHLVCLLDDFQDLVIANRWCPFADGRNSTMQYLEKERLVRDEA